MAVDSARPALHGDGLAPGATGPGDRPRELAVVVNTHSHHDHAGSNVQLREATGCQVWIHRLEGPALERGSFFGGGPAFRTRPTACWTTGSAWTWPGGVRGGAHPGAQPWLDRPARPRAGPLLLRDALQAQGTATQGIPGAQDRPGYARTLLRVEGLEIEHLLAAHPYLPFTESYVRPRAEVRRYLAECRRFVEEMDGEILAAVRQGQDGDPPGVTSGDLRSGSAPGGVPPRLPADGVYSCGYLARLEDAGQVRRRGGGPGAPEWD